MEKDCLVVRKSPRGPVLCYSRDEELLMEHHKAFIVRAVLSNHFPNEEYSVFKEVRKYAKKGISSPKES